MSGIDLLGALGSERAPTVIDAAHGRKADSSRRSG